MNSVKRITFTVLVTLICTIFFSSCSKEEKNIIKKSVFIEILSELMILDNMTLPQTDKLVLLKQVFEKYGISPEQFSLTKDHYRDHADFWIDVYERVQERIKEEEKTE